MSQKTIDKIDNVVQTALGIIKKNGLPELPIDKNPPIGDFAIICFPAAKALGKKPNKIAEEISQDSSMYRSICSQ